MDRYVKFVLTVIAAALVGLCIAMTRWAENGRYVAVVQDDLPLATIDSRTGTIYNIAGIKISTPTGRSLDDVERDTPDPYIKRQAVRR